jgi:hypothetical protein
MVEKRKNTRLQLAKKITRRIQPSKVRVVSIMVNADGTWHAITVGDQANIERAQPRIEAVIEKLRDRYQIDDSYENVTAAWLHWARDRTRPRAKRGLRKKMSDFISGRRRR